MSDQSAKKERRSGQERRNHTDRRHVRLLGGEWPLEEEQRTGRDRRIGERRSVRQPEPATTPLATGKGR